MEKMDILMKKKNHLIKVIQQERNKHQKAKEKYQFLHRNLISMKTKRDKMFKNFKKKCDKGVNLKKRIKELKNLKFDYQKRLEIADFEANDVIMI